MKHLLRKISREKAELLGRVKIGDVDVSVAASNGMVSGVVNGFKVVDAGLYEDFIERITPVLSMVISKIFRDKIEDGGKLQIWEKEWDTKGKYPSKNLLESLLKDLGRHLDDSAINIDRESDPEVSPAKEEALPANIDIDGLLENLQKFSEQASNVYRYSDRAMDRARVLTRRKLIPEMYGAEDTQGVIDGIKSNVQDTEAAVNKMGFDMNGVVKSTNRLVARLKKVSQTSDDKKYVSTILIPDITNAFYGIRDAVIKTVVALTPLTNIDDVFRANTQNPASWFLPTNVLEDLKEAHAILIEFLSDVPDIEVGVVEPLSVIKMRAFQDKD